MIAGNEEAAILEPSNKLPVPGLINVLALLCLKRSCWTPFPFPVQLCSPPPAFSSQDLEIMTVLLVIVDRVNAAVALSPIGTWFRLEGCGHPMERVGSRFLVSRD